MNKSRLNFRPLPWLMAPVPSIFLVACGGGGQDTILGTGGMAPVASSAPKVTLSADSLFDFDSATVKPTGRAELDKLASDLRGLDFDVINITGHTDRIGRQAYNQKLSTERGQAVANYLVTSAGIPAGKMNVKGVNGADPVTKPGECVGTKVTPALISCLQPDRRVDIEVTGQR